MHALLHLQTLSRAWNDSTRPIPTLYGAVRGLSALGDQAIRMLVLPAASMYFVNLDALEKMGEQFALLCARLKAAIKVGFGRRLSHTQDALMMLFRSQRLQYPFQAEVSSALPSELPHAQDEVSCYVGPELAPEWSAVWPFVRGDLVGEGKQDQMNVT